MLQWFVCRLAPAIPFLTDVDAPPLADPSSSSDPAQRAREAGEALAAAPFRPRPDIDAFRAVLALGCRDLVTREADQHPDTAGRTPNWAPFPAFEEVSIPVAEGLALTGRHSVGAPGAPVIFVLHGIFDSHTSLYVVEACEVLRRWGFHVFALDLRDHGRLRASGKPPTLGVHEGRDLFTAARAISEKEGVSVGMLGFSWGGMCAVRAAHEATLAGAPEVLRGGVLSLSAPLDIHEAVLAIDDPTRLPRAHGLVPRLVAAELRSIFSRHLGIRLHERGRLAHHAEDYEGYIREIVLPACPDLPNLVGAALGKARCAQPSVLGSLAVPTALLHSTDDMLVPVTHLHKARAAAAGNPWVTPRELPAGGHTAFGVVDPVGTLGLLSAFFGTLRDG